MVAVAVVSMAWHGVAWSDRHASQLLGRQHHGHVDHAVEKLFFRGLVRPIGPTIPLVELQGRWVAGVLSGAVRLPDRAAMDAGIERHRTRQRKTWLDTARYTLEVDDREHARALTRDLARGA